VDVETLTDLEEFLDKTDFPGQKLVVRIRGQHGDLELPNEAIRIACRGGLDDKRRRQEFHGLVVENNGVEDTHFSGRKKLLRDLLRIFDRK